MALSDHSEHLTPQESKKRKKRIPKIILFVIGVFFAALVIYMTVGSSLQKKDMGNNPVSLESK